MFHVGIKKTLVHKSLKYLNAGNHPYTLCCRCIMEIMANRLSFKIYLVVLCVVVFTPQSNQSNDFLGLIELSWQVEKLLNLFLLFPLSYFIFKLYPQIRNLINLLICSISSSLIEMIQFAIPGRFPDITDIFANTLGVGLLLLIMRSRDSIHSE